MSLSAISEEGKLPERGDSDMYEFSRSEMTGRRDEFRSRRMHSVPNFTDQEMDNALNAYFHEDPNNRKTWTRILVEKYFSKVNIIKEMLDSLIFSKKHCCLPVCPSIFYSILVHLVLPVTENKACAIVK